MVVHICKPSTPLEDPNDAVLSYRVRQRRGRDVIDQKQLMTELNIQQSLPLGMQGLTC